MKKSSLRKKWLAWGTLLVSLSLAGTGEAAELSLQQAVEMALAQNTGLRITQKGEETARAALRNARGQNSISVSASDNWSISKREYQDRNHGNNVSLTGSLPVYSGGKNQANIESGELGVDTAVLTTERGREDLKLQVIKAYYDALEARQTIAVRQESVDNYQAHLTNVSQLYSAGSKARVDVLRSSVELSDARQSLIKAQNAYEVNLAALRNLINMDREEPLTLTSDFSFEAFGVGMSDAIAYAYENRKDLLVDAYKVRQEELSVKMAKAGFLPTVNLTLGTGRSDDFDPSSEHYHSITAGVGVNWNIFDSGVTQSQVDKATTAWDVAKLTLKKDQETVDLELRQAYYNMREAEKRFQSTSEAVNQAEEDYYIASEKYRAGEGLMLDIIDAQLALSTAKLNYISAQYDYARYKAEVENKMGLSLTEEERAAADRLLLTMEAAVQEAGRETEKVELRITERKKAPAAASQDAKPQPALTAVTVAEGDTQQAAREMAQPQGVK